ncbi:MAG: hypothetical protein EPO11_02670 [Gammaproteobacteria bacterium]|nr:MAG: hypothetical protein EPO11_02670 [Gammaproteobacteria bacterium]
MSSPLDDLEGKFQQLQTSLQNNFSLSEKEALAFPIRESSELDPASKEVRIAHEIRLICLEELIKAYYYGEYTYYKDRIQTTKEIAINLTKVQELEKKANTLRKGLNLEPKKSLITETDRSLSWLSKLMQPAYDAFPWGNEPRLFLMRALRWASIAIQGVNKAYNHRATQAILKGFSLVYNHPITQFILTASGLIYGIRIALNLIKVAAATFFPKTKKDKERGTWKRLKLAFLQPDVLSQNLNDFVWGGINLALMMLTGGFYLIAAPIAKPIIQGTVSLVVKAVASLSQFLFDVVFDRHKKKKYVSPFDSAAKKLADIETTLPPGLLKVTQNELQYRREAENHSRGQQLTSSASILIGMIFWFSPSLATACRAVIPPLASLVIQGIGATFAWFGSIYGGFGRKIANLFKKTPKEIKPVAANATSSTDATLRPQLKKSQPIDAPSQSKPSALPHSEPSSLESKPRLSRTISTTFFSLPPAVIQRPPGFAAPKNTPS